MTLSYWWMHWFWITSRIILTVSEDTLFTSHSTVPPMSTARTPPNVNPPITEAPSNATLVKVKPSPKKFGVSPNMTTKYFPNKEVTVITHPNTTEITLNVTDNQTLIFNHTENFTYVNDTSYNQSLLLTSEKIMEREDETSGNLSAAGITGITLGCVVVVGVICGISYFLYRSRGFNRPQVLNDRCSNPDSSGYIDDASVRDNSEEMYSLDNDSFLNSLEAMTIQNYWTDTVKHTKL